LINAVEELQQAAAHVGGDLAHHPEVVVDEASAAGTGVRGDVSRVRVGVEEAVREQLLQVRFHGASSEQGSVNARGVELGGPVDLDAGSVLHRQHLRGRPLPQNTGHLDPVGVLEALAEPVCAFTLQGVIDLLVEDPGALVVDRDPVSRRAVRFGVHGLQPARQQPHVLEVDVEELFQARALDLDDDALAVEPGEVDLAQTRRGDGFGVELVKELRDGAAQIALDGGDGEFGVKGRHVVLELFELRDELGRKHVDARRKLLPDFNESRAQLDQTFAQPGSQRRPPCRNGLWGHPSLFLGVGPRPAHKPELEEEDDRERPDLERALQGAVLAEAAPPAAGRRVRGAGLLLRRDSSVRATAAGLVGRGAAPAAPAGPRLGLLRRLPRQQRGLVGVPLGQALLSAGLELPDLAGVHDAGRVDDHVDGRGGGGGGEGGRRRAVDAVCCTVEESGRAVEGAAVEGHAVGLNGRGRGLPAGDGLLKKKKRWNKEGKR